MASSERYIAVDNFAKQLVSEGHTDTVVIKEQQDILRFVVTSQLSSAFSALHHQLII